MKPNLTIDELIEFKQKTGLNQVPEWAWERVIPMEEVEDLQFYHYRENTTTVQQVPLKNVIGTYHCNYSNRSWIEMLLNLSRNKILSPDHAYQAFDNPDDSDDVVSFSRYGDNYIIGGGNHRTCFAKFGDREFVTAEVTEYFFDFQAATAYKYLKQYFQTSHQGNHFDFKSKFIHVIAVDRKELIAFYQFFFNWNYKPVQAQQTRNAIWSIVEYFLLFGWFFQWIFRVALKINLKNEKNDHIIIRWMNTPTKHEELFALMQTKLSVESN